MIHHRMLGILSYIILAMSNINAATLDSSGYRVYADRLDPWTEHAISILSNQSSIFSERDSAWEYIRKYPNQNYVDTLGKLYLQIKPWDSLSGYFYLSRQSFERNKTINSFDILELARVKIGLRIDGTYYISIRRWAENMLADSIYFNRDYVINTLLSDYQAPENKYFQIEVLYALRSVMFSVDTGHITTLRNLTKNEAAPLQKFINDSIFAIVSSKQLYKMYRNILPKVISHDTIIRAALDTSREYTEEIRIASIENMELAGYWDSLEDVRSLRVLSKINQSIMSATEKCTQSDSICSASRRAYTVINSRILKTVKTQSNKCKTTKRNRQYINLLGQPANKSKHVLLTSTPQI